MKLGDRFICMEWGFQASERGLNLEAARLEFRQLMETELGARKTENPAEREGRAKSEAIPEPYEVIKCALERSIVERRVDQRWDNECEEYDFWIQQAKDFLRSRPHRAP